MRLEIRDIETARQTQRHTDTQIRICPMGTESHISLSLWINNSCQSLRTKNRIFQFTYFSTFSPFFLDDFCGRFFFLFLRLILWFRIELSILSVSIANISSSFIVLLLCTSVFFYFISSCIIVSLISNSISFHVVFY